MTRAERTNTNGGGRHPKGRRCFLLLRSLYSSRVRSGTALRLFFVSQIAFYLIFFLSSSSSIKTSTSDNDAIQQGLSGVGQMRSAEVERQLLVVVPGYGDAKRMPGLVQSLTALQTSCRDGWIGFRCVVYVWNEELVPSASLALPFCAIIFSEGMWTHHMLKVTNATMQSAGAPVTHVAVLLDDVDVRSVDMALLLRCMERAHFAVASPAMASWMPATGSRPHCVAHRTDFVDMLFTVFTSPAWLCWHHQLDTLANPLGWGYDLTLADVCNVTIGVVDSEEAHHPVSDTATRTYDSSQAWGQMTAWIMSAVGAANASEASAYHDQVMLVRPNTFDYCAATQLYLASSRYHQSKTHRGGWKAVVEALVLAQEIMQGDISTKIKNHAVALVDCIEEWFQWEKRGAISTPWVGIAHLVLGEDLPPHLTERSLDLSAPDVRASVNNSVAILFFTQEMRNQVDRKLKMLGFDHIHTCHVRHPVAFEASARLYDPDVDLPMAMSNGPVILLGQQYRRVATIHRLQTKRRKIWLPSRVNECVDEESIQQETKNELAAEGVDPDSSVRVLSLDSFAEYDRMIRQSIVVVDLWAAGANSSVMEAIAVEAPFFIRRLAGPVEYLGEAYPLFFSTFDELQDMLSDDTRLRQLLHGGHVYLQNMDKTPYTIESFARQLHACTLAGLRAWKKR